MRRLVLVGLVPLVPLALAGCPESGAEALPVAEDLDQDGIRNEEDTDIDGDGVENSVDEDIDGDGTPNVQDDDIDGDGTSNADDGSDFGLGNPEGTGTQADPDGDGVPNIVDNDDDGDGVPDGVLAPHDVNGDGIPEDEDHDADGFCINVEGGLIACDDGAPPGSGLPDSDGDGLPDVIDPDDDGDGILDPDDDNNNGQDPVDPPPGNGSCVPFTFTADEALPPRILLVVDKSGSMGDPAAGFPGSKWDTTRDTLNNVVSSLNDSVEFGLMLYPNNLANPDDTCAQGSTIVNVAPNNASAIISTLNSTGPGGGTPTAPSLSQARNTLDALGATGGTRAVVIATDGGPNCNGSLNGNTCRCVSPDPADCQAFAENCLDDANSINAAAQLNGAGYPVFVIGIPGAENFTDVLSALANAGGTAQAGAVPFYDANSDGDLASALEQIAIRVGACRFDLPQNVAPGDVTVDIAGAPIGRDTSRQNGWDLVDPNTIELFGVPCNDAVTNGATVTLQVCPG